MNERSHYNKYTKSIIAFYILTTVSKKNTASFLKVQRLLYAVAIDCNIKNKK